MQYFQPLENNKEGKTYKCMIVNFGAEITYYNTRSFTQHLEVSIFLSIQKGSLFFRKFQKRRFFLHLLQCWFLLESTVWARSKSESDINWSFLKFNYIQQFIHIIKACFNLFQEAVSKKFSKKKLYRYMIINNNNNNKRVAYKLPVVDG